MTDAPMPETQLNERENRLMRQIATLMNQKAALRESHNELLDVLHYAKYYVAKYCHTQGNMLTFFQEILGPIDKAIINAEKVGK